MSLPQQRVTVLVIGDIAQSPRMVGHASALADLGINVDLIAQVGGTIPAAIRANPRITLHRLPAWRVNRQRLPRVVFLFYAIARVIGSTAWLLWQMLTIIPRPDFILVQNPPSIPSLAICRLIARLRHIRWGVDWHNYGASMLALRLGVEHFVVKLAQRHERSVGRSADVHFCVSATMAADLATHWGIPAAHVLYDRPRDDLLAARVTTRLGAQATLLARLVNIPLENIGVDALLVSATSWSADEDLGLLLSALDDYETRGECAAAKWPRLCVVVTGKGPLRAAFEEALATRAYRFATVTTAWLEEADYLALLRQADLGLCFHRSSSGVDLPMKIQDYFGAELPVCAYDYGECLRELVAPGDTGWMFRTARTLCDTWVELLVNDPTRLALTKARALVTARHARGWHEEWQAVAGPALTAIARPPESTK